MRLYERFNDPTFDEFLPGSSPQFFRDWFQAR
jgi:hypothetical protein